MPFALIDLDTYFHPPYLAYRQILILVYSRIANLSSHFLKNIDISPSLYYDILGSEVRDMSFAEQLKRARVSQGFTQQQVADLLGITNSTYCGYETGKRQPDVAKIKLLACALNTSCDVLLETGFSTEREADSPKSSKLNEAMEIFETLNPDFQDYALEQIKKLSELQDKT